MTVIAQETIEVFDTETQFTLESGEVLSSLTIAYTIQGNINATADNIIWVCHALTANANATEWWGDLIGEGKTFDTNKYAIVCANIIGSPYGSTSPLTINPNTGKNYGLDFPLVTIRDMARAWELLRKHLGINSIHMLIGGSMGGQQALEWAIINPDVIQNLVLLATNAQHSPWGIAFNEAQRLAIQAGERGLEAARAIAMLSYRNYNLYSQTQADEDNVLQEHKAATYQQYQGQKLASRFDAHCYVSLSRSMDSHNVGRGRGGVKQALQQVKAKTVVIGISTDILFPPQEQSFLARNIKGAYLGIVSSIYGHDAFLIETQQIANIIKQYKLV